MKVKLIFKDGQPRLSIYGLEGVILDLIGRDVINVTDELYLISSYFFFVEKTEDGWRFGCRSNVYINNGENVYTKLLNKANEAITQKQPTDLSQEFNAINEIDPYDFIGMFPRMNERHEPIYDNHSRGMREKLRKSMTLEEIEADEHLKRFLEDNPAQFLHIDGTITEID